MTNRPTTTSAEDVHEDHLQKIAQHLFSLLGDPNDDTLNDLLTIAEMTFTPWVFNDPPLEVDDPDRTAFREGMFALALERMAINIHRYNTDAAAATFCSDHNIH